MYLIRGKKKRYIPNVIAVKTRNWLANILENVTLNQNLRAISGVHPSVGIQEIAVVDMTGTESQRRHTGSDIVPVIVVLSYCQVTGIFSGIAVRVADQRCFEVVVEIDVRDCDPVAGVGYIDEAVVIVFAVGEVGGYVADGKLYFGGDWGFLGGNGNVKDEEGNEHMVDPNICGSLNANSITISCKNLLTDDVSYNDVFGFVDVKTDANKS